MSAISLKLVVSRRSSGGPRACGTRAVLSPAVISWTAVSSENTGRSTQRASRTAATTEPTSATSPTRPSMAQANSIEPRARSVDETVRIPPSIAPPS